MTTEEAKKTFEAIRQQNKVNWPTPQNPNIDFSKFYDDYSQELPPIIIYDFKLNEGYVIGTDSSGILVFKRKYEGRDLLISDQKIIPSFKIGEDERLTFDGKKFILRQNVSEIKSQNFRQLFIMTN